ncbi:MAG TPA: response regulator [Blastocatellia bacterium]|nr:response regulator [Blastocatellia bacterium]
MHIATDQGLLHEGILAAKSGDKPTAYSLLQRAAQSDPYNEMVWLWLASVADHPADQIAHLRKVLELNPRQKQADSNLKKLLLSEGIAVAKSGNKAQAKDLLLELIRLEPANELAWFWLASVSTTVEDTSHHLNKVLQINPNNDHARTWLTRLQALVEKSTVKLECPLCQTSWNQKVVYCPECHAILTLDDLNNLIENPTADWQLILRGVNHYQSLPADKFDFNSHFNLGIAYLNLKQFGKGVAHLQMAAQLRPEDEVLRGKVNDLVAWQQTQPRQNGSTSNGSDPNKNKAVSPNCKTILAVDDSPTVRKIVSMTLEKQGHRVISVADGVEALAKLNEMVPDLIFLDISMPHLDGYQICKIIKGKDGTKSVPIIMLSGKDGFIDKVRGRLSGATDYITKPFEPTALVEAVKKHCLRRN